MTLFLEIPVSNQIPLALLHQVLFIAAIVSLITNSSSPLYLLCLFFVKDIKGQPTSVKIFRISSGHLTTAPILGADQKCESTASQTILAVIDLC